MSARRLITYCPTCGAPSPTTTLAGRRLGATPRPCRVCAEARAEAHMADIANLHVNFRMPIKTCADMLGITEPNAEYFWQRVKARIRASSST